MDSSCHVFFDKIDNYKERSERCRSKITCQCKYIVDPIPQCFILVLCCSTKTLFY